jgi:hypothetical protein
MNPTLWFQTGLFLLEGSLPHSASRFMKSWAMEIENEAGIVCLAQGNQGTDTWCQIFLVRYCMYMEKHVYVQY